MIGAAADSLKALAPSSSGRLYRTRAVPGANVALSQTRRAPSATRWSQAGAAFELIAGYGGEFPVAGNNRCI